MDDTTETIADYYAISTEIVDLLDEMEKEGCPTERLSKMVEQAAGHTVSIQPSGQSDPSGEKGKGQPEGQPGPASESRIEWKITPKEDTFFLEVLTTSEHRPEMKHQWLGEIEIWPDGDTHVNYMTLNYINQETPKAEVENPHAIHVYPGEGRKRSLRQDCENIAQQCYEETQRLEMDHRGERKTPETRERENGRDQGKAAGDRTKGAPSPQPPRMTAIARERRNPTEAKPPDTHLEEWRRGKPETT